MTQYDKTGEISMLFEMFEKVYKTSSVYVSASWERYPRRTALKDEYYCNGTINNLFIMFLNGYELGKHVSR